MYVFCTTAGCLIGAQMCCHLLSSYEYNRWFPPELLLFQRNRRVHSTEAKVETCMSQVHFCQIPVLEFGKKTERGGDCYHTWMRVQMAVFTYSGTFLVYFTMKCNQGQSPHFIAIYFILARLLANFCNPGRRHVLLSSGVLNEVFASCSNHLSSHYHESLPLLPPLRIHNQRDAKQD